MYKTISILFLLVGFHQNLRASLADSLQSERMEEVEVKAYSSRTLSDDRNGRLYWNMESLADMPHVLGSADPLRSLQLLPGVATNNDYTSGIHIQGCAASQSVLNMDGAPIFNASHLLGLFSVFNASHFRGMALVKNRHDAAFSNRLGGEVSFYPTDSIARKVHLDATVSFMESEGTLTLPTGEHSTLYLSGRGSYLNLLYGNLLEIDEMQLRYGLQDYNLTFVQQAGAHDKIRLSLYHGQDRMNLLQEDFADENKLNWQNTAAALHWQHHSSQFILQQNATFSRYCNTLDMGISSVALNLSSGITQARLRRPFGMDTGQSAMERQVWNTTITISVPCSSKLSGSFIENETPKFRETPTKPMPTFRSDISIRPSWSVLGGLRLSSYHSHGRSFISPDPRITLNYHPSPSHTLSVHYGLYHQYLHQMSVSNGGLPVDYWTSSSPSVRPQQAHSIALGYHFRPQKGMMEISAEVYYKKLSHQHEYSGSILDFFTQVYHIENNMIHGKGYNYGLNLMLKKNKGKLSGWVSYAIGSSRRRFPELSPTEWFNSTFDRRHDLSVIANYRFNRHWSLGGDFVYASGTPYTKAKSVYVINNNLVSEYGKYNGSNLPATHRMDIALTYRFTPRGHREQSLNLSIYNLYAPAQRPFQLSGLSEENFGYKHVYSLCRMLAFHRLYFKILSHETILHIHTRTDTSGMCHIYGLHGGRRRRTPNAISRRGMD